MPAQLAETGDVAFSQPRSGLTNYTTAQWTYLAGLIRQ